MYANPTQTQTWNPNAPPPPAPPSGQPNQSPSQTPAQQQPQPAWAQQPNGQQYTSRPNQIPPISQALPPPGPTMQTLQPSHPDQYRSLPPPQMYPPQFPPQQQMQYGPQQPAPRQRTAIACRYCRRRKIRCSGFDQSEDGRCTNCHRFSQECVFTPVSAQSQAFVPAHSVWRGQQPPPNAQLFGAYGQPLRTDPYVQQPGQPAPAQQQPPGQYPPAPQGYQQPQYQQPAQMQPVPVTAGSKRANDEPHTPTLPPPAPGTVRSDTYEYPEPAQITAAEDATKSLLFDPNERKEERLRNGEIKDVGVQTDDRFEWKERAS